MELQSVNPSFADTVRRFIRFGIVGGSGVVVDMVFLYLLTDPTTLALNVSVGKALAAEAAVVNNFIWNDVWTFRDLAGGRNNWSARFNRFAKFNLICLVGIGLNILLLNREVRYFHLNVYLANLAAIFVVCFWNFGMNLKFGWSKPQIQ